MLRPLSLSVCHHHHRSQYCSPISHNPASSRPMGVHLPRLRKRWRGLDNLWLERALVVRALSIIRPGERWDVDCSLKNGGHFPTEAQIPRLSWCGLIHMGCPPNLWVGVAIGAKQRVWASYDGRLPIRHFGGQGPRVDIMG